jgi:hypothetical protein
MEFFEDYLECGFNNQQTKRTWIFLFKREATFIDQPYSALTEQAASILVCDLAGSPFFKFDVKPRSDFPRNTSQVFNGTENWNAKSFCCVFRVSIVLKTDHKAVRVRVRVRVKKRSAVNYASSLAYTSLQNLKFSPQNEAHGAAENET